MGLLDYFFGTSTNASTKTETNYNEEELSEEEKTSIEKAISSEGISLQYESYERKNDKKFMTELLKREKKISIRDIGDELKKDKDIILLSLKCDPNNLEYAYYELKRDEDVVIEAVKYNEGMLTGFEDEKILDNFDFMVKIIKDNKWENIKFASENLRNNKEFCLEAAKKNYHTKEYFGNDVLSDSEFMKEIEIYI